jgi:prepilin-type N-terminal cleavage/methylation domain-containing protein
MSARVWIRASLGILRRRERGFTLIELLVAAAIFIIVLGLLSGVFSSVTSISSQVSAKLDAVRLGREIFDLMGRDLSQTATTRFALGTNVPLQFCVNPSDSQVPPIYKMPSAVFWQASIARDRSLGNLALVGYFVEHLSTNKSQLRRILIEPNDAANYQIYSATSSWLNPATLTQFAGSTNSASSINADRGWVANGVVGLWVRCLDANGAVITANGANVAQGYTFDSRLGYRSGSGSNAIVRTGVNALPAFVDIGLVCVASRDVDRVTSFPAIPAGSPETFDSDIDAYLSSFRASNPRVKTAISLRKRFRVPQAN